MRLDYNYVTPNKNCVHNNAALSASCWRELEQYAARMTHLDLSVHSCPSRSAFLAQFLASITPLPSEEATILHAAAIAADGVLLKHGCRLLLRVPWKFVRIAPAQAANDLPHTLGDSIVLGPSFFAQAPQAQLVTLIHEKIHVFQKLLPAQAGLFIASVLGYYHSAPCPGGLRQVLRMRCNPDLDSRLYSRDGLWFPFEQYHVRPHSLRDASLACVRMCQGCGSPAEVSPRAADHGYRYEHPLEEMAYVVSGQLATGTLPPSSAQLL